MGTSHRLHELRHALRAIGTYSHRSGVTSAHPSTGKSGSATPSPSMSQPYAPSSTHTASVPLPLPLPPPTSTSTSSPSSGSGDGDGDASGSSASGTGIAPGSGSSIVAISRSSDETSPSPCVYERCCEKAARPAARTADTRDAAPPPLVSSSARRLCSHGVSAGGCAHPTSPPNSATSSHRTEPLKGRLGATCASEPSTTGTQPAASASKSRREVGESPGSTRQKDAFR